MRVLGGMALVLLLSACGPKTLDARLRDAEKLADRASNHLDRAEKAAVALEPKDMESALDDAKRTLAEKDIELYREEGPRRARRREGEEEGEGSPAGQREGGSRRERSEDAKKKAAAAKK